MSFAQSIIKELLTAIDERTVLARQLIYKLILETSQPETAEIDAGNYDFIENCEKEILSGDWYYDVHGEHCLFINKITNQKLEVSLGSDIDLENLNPYFFYDFLATTQKFNHLASFFQSPFVDMLCFFEELEKQEVLEQINRIEYRKISAK